MTTTQDARHLAPGALISDGLRLAVATFTVAPLRPRAVERHRGNIAISLAPYFGLALGAVTGLLVVGLNHVIDSPFVVAMISVGVLAALTRGRPLDGLAGTVDALGIRDRERAFGVLRRPAIGALGGAAVILAVVIQAACLSALALNPVTLTATWRVVASLAAAAGAGRLAATLACRRGVPAARPDGLGAMFADGVGWLEIAFGLVAVGVVSIFVVPARAWQGPVVVAVALAATVALTAFVRHRLGGITVAMLGACIELATTGCLVGFLIRSPY